MPNSLVQKYRDALAAQGVIDPRSDDEVTAQLGQLAEQSNRGIFDQFPDFSTDYRDIREANAPSLLGEAGRAIKAGTQELAATGLGLGALATGSDYLKQKAQSFQEDAAANAPTIPTVEDIAPGASTAGKVFSKDALRYGISKVAGAAPALAESVGLAAGGAALGSTIGPEGTVAGAVEGGLEGFLGKGIVKSAIRRLLAKGVLKETSEAAVADAIKAGAPDLLKAVQTEASAIAARRAGTAANALNMYGLNAGALYNETGDRTTAAVGGAVGALPAVVLPEIVIHKLYPGVAKGVGQQLGNQYVTRLATEALKDSGVMGSAMALQETSNVIAKNIAAGKDATDISDEDWKRIREAAIGGALAGPIAAPLTARTNAETFNPEAATARAEAARNAAEQQTATSTPTSAPIAPVPAEQAPVISPARRVALMTDQQKAARLGELTQRDGSLTPDEQQELTLLQALTVPNSAAKAGIEPVTGQTLPVIPGVPGEDAAKAVRIEANDHPEVAAKAPELLPSIVKDELAIDPNAYKGEADPLSSAAAESATPPAVQEPAGITSPAAAEVPSESAQILPPARESAAASVLDQIITRALNMPDLQKTNPELASRIAYGKATKEEIDRALSGISEQAGGRKPLPPTWRVTVQEPVVPGESKSGYQQIDMLDEKGNNAGSTTPDKLRAQGYDVPDLSALKTGQYNADLSPLSTGPALGDGGIAQPSVVAPAPVEVPSVPESPRLEQRLREELNHPTRFDFGKIDETKQNMDLRDDPRFDALTPEQAARLPVEGAIDATGNRSKTRVAAVLEAPDGHYVKTGLLVPQEMSVVGAAGERDTGPAVQSMARIRGKGSNGEKLLKEGGNRPALLADVIASGYKLRGIVHFDEKPGNIFQRFDSRSAYDAAYAETQKYNGTAAEKTIPTRSLAEGVARRNVLDERNSVQAQIDALSKELPNADPARAAEITDEINQQYSRLSALPEPRLMQSEPQPTPVPIEAARTDQFATAAARIRQAGAKVDVFGRAFLQASIADELGRRIDALSERYMAAKPQDQPALQAQIERLQAQLDAADKVRGVTYSPWHVAVGLEDVQNAQLVDLVALLHEGGHSMLARDPVMQSRVVRAVTSTFADLSADLAKRQEASGIRELRTNDPEELVVSTMAQKLAAEGVPDAPSLARAVVQWVKDLYYRVAMGIQAAFGRDPDPQLALDWFENQMRRVVGGDYDYRFANIFERFQPETPAQEIVRLPASGGTPMEVSDFYDARIGKVRQPQVLPETRDGIAWNLKFMTEDDNPGKGLDIPAPEARARIMGAAINEVNTLAEKAYDELVPKVEGAERMPFDEFWKIVGKGDPPKDRLGDLENRFAGSSTAIIGGEKMTEPMNQQARVEAKKLLYRTQEAVVSREAQKIETGTRAENTLVDTAKALTKVEGDLRNAEMHEATLRDSLKGMIREMANGIKRGLDTAFAAGELARAVRETEGLAEKDPIPPEYQSVFKAVLADQVPVFSYAEAIAKLDMPLKDMTRAEIIDGIRDNASGDNVLARLMEPRNKPLLVALAALAKKNAAQLDLIQMRAIKDPQQYLALKAQLDEIRSASPAKLREMEKAINEGKKAATFADRIKQNAVKMRAKLGRAQDTIQETESTRELLEKMNGALAAKIDEMETNGMPAPSEWMPYEGNKYLAMSQDENGAWKSTQRTLEWTPEGPAKNAEQMLSDLAANQEYLRTHADRKGSKTYQMVERQTDQLAMLDAMRKTPEIKRSWYEKFLLPSAKLLVSGGGAGAARAEQMLNRFQFIVFSKWHNELELPAIKWSNELRRVTEAAGMKDQRAFMSQVYEPVLYMIESEPGREEPAILREAVRAAKRRLTSTPTEGFDDALKSFLRATKDMSERFVKVAEDNGLFVQDDKLGELRQAVSRGWLTVMRSMNTSTVSTILRDMENAGWKMVFKDAKEGTTSVKPLDKGVAAGNRVVSAASFDNLLPENATSEADAQARTQVLENADVFGKAIGGFFTPGIVQRWLEPFINKPGESVFSNVGEKLDPLDVQAAWQQSGGNVAKWIDLLGERVGLEKNVDLGDEMMLGDMSLEAQWRAQMLKNLDNLFLMESRIAADSNQTRGLFDATGRPPHLIMDARENEMLPPEHITHAAFDRESSRNLLATLAFHAAFGRNGEAMTKAIGEIQSNLRARTAAYQHVMAQANTKEARVQMAKDLGYDFKDLKRAASISRTVEQGIGALKAQFGFNSTASGMNDVRGGLELLHFIASQTVNNPKTGLLNLLQPTQRALARKSIGAATVRDTAGSYGEIGKQFFGQVLESFGLHLLRASRHAADIGAAQGQGFGQLPWSEMAGIAAGRRGEDLPSPIKTMRTISGVQRKGIRPGFGESREFPRMQAVPVLSNVMHGIGLAAAISNGTAEARAIEGVVRAAMQHFALNPDHLNDSSYRLTHSDVAAQDRTLAMDKAAFDYFRSKMVEYNIGPLEKVARDAMDRQTRGEPILTKDQVLKAAMLSGNEVDLQASINTNPATWDTNPILKFATPLLGWPLRQMNQVHEAMRNAEGRATALQAMKTLGILAAWSMPIGLAFTFLTDQYDDKILKKKTNLGRVEGTAAIPGVGPALALATSDIPAKEQLIAMFQRLSRAGNIYGLGFDALATTLAGMDPTSGQRPFSMDGRILAFSQIANLTQALSNWYNSGFATTYANFDRPLIQAVVGSGPLQAVDILGNVMGIDNQEMRINSRINASQWLRAAGREVGLELRRGGGGSTAPTPMSVWTREMYLAALASDSLDFQENYRRAIDAARSDGDPNPEAKVLESWKSRNPLDVFRTKPDDIQLARALSVMSENGRQSVQDALTLYKRYTDLISVSQPEQYQHRILRQIEAVSSPQSLRSRMAAMALSNR